MNSLPNVSEKVFKEHFLQSFDIGEKSQYLKVRSANNKGRSDNRCRPLPAAMKMEYLQLNTSFNAHWCVIDIDRDFDPNEIFDKNLPIPTAIIGHKEKDKNNHVQIIYELEDPVYLQHEFRQSKAYKYYKAVYKALVKVFDADPHFNRLLSKNPFSPKWNTTLLTNETYKLGDLAAHLDLNWAEEVPQQKNFKARKISTDYLVDYQGAVAGSRNSSTFDYCRLKAYGYRSKSNCSERELIDWTINLVKEVNKDNSPMLSEKECEEIGNSIAVWTYANIDPCKKLTEKYDSAAREKSLKTRQKQAAKKRNRIERLLKKNPAISNREISRTLGKGYSTDTVNRAVKDIKAQQVAAKEKSKASRKQVVGIVPSDDNVSERFVNQFVMDFSPFRPVGKGLAT